MVCYVCGVGSAHKRAMYLKHSTWIGTHGNHVQGFGKYLPHVGSRLSQPNKTFTKLISTISDANSMVNYATPLPQDM